jgi:hypothetical protein
MKNNIRQRQASMRSPWRTNHLSRDAGQRYKVTYRDPLGTLRVFGYADNESDLTRILAKLLARKSATQCKVIDRDKKKGAETPNQSTTA